MSWLYYLLEANLYLLLFYGFYRLFLHNETFYNLNRCFLLFVTIISFLLPVTQIGALKLSVTQNLNPINDAGTKTEITDVNWLYIFYLFVALCFAFKLSINVYRIISIWFKSKKHNIGDVTLVEVHGDSTAFSFFNLLFIHPQLANQPAVLKHEMVHIKQRHSFDIIFFEIVQVICWFNPILYFVKKDIKLLHEYIADELTTSADVQKHEYALFLIQNSFGLYVQPITNQIFNQSILKRRINMLNKKRTAGWARLRLLLALPLTGAMLCTSTMAFTKDYGYVDLLPEKSKITVPIKKNPQGKVDTLRLKKAKKQDQIKFPPPIVKPDRPRKGSKTPPPPVEPPPPRKDQIKFPPPIVKQDKPRKGSETPPPPTEPPPPRVDQIKFPPPIVKPDKPRKGLKTPPPPKVDQIKFPPPIVKPDKPRKGSKTPPPPVEPPNSEKTREVIITGDPIKN